MIGALLLVIITILFPPVGVAMVAGCGPDLLINICLTILAYIPGHIHAFYVEYVYYDRREQARRGVVGLPPASGVYSDRVQSGGLSRAQQQRVLVVEEERGGMPPAPPGYGTV